MSNDTLNCGAIEGASNRMSFGWNAKRDLRLENQCLKERLRVCEDIASRHGVMLREGDHRIKNSLQLVSSLMTLQARREESVAAREALRSAAARVSCVSAIHDALQATSGIDLVDLGPVLQKMCVALQAMAGDAGHIEIHVEAESVEIPVALAQPIILIVNELVVNALRHAFPGRDTGAVHISLGRVENNAVIQVTDDGVGLLPGHAEAQGYGMALVAMMIKQVGGSVLTTSKAGTQFTITVPITAAPRS